MKSTIGSLTELHQIKPRLTVSDQHPDYISSRYADSLNLASHSVQHHYAHVLSGMIDNGIEPPLLGISWDGTGLGTDNTIWGGEFLHLKQARCERAAHLRPFKLPGGERAIIEPFRSAISLLYEIAGDDLLGLQNLSPLRHTSKHELSAIVRMLEQDVNSPLTSSMGRLFDGVASLLGLCQESSFEGHAAMRLQFAAEEAACSDSYDFKIEDQERPFVIDWRPVITQILRDLASGLATNIIAAKFHNGLVRLIVRSSRLIGESTVLLTGGCFQNKLLLEAAINSLEESGFQPKWHGLVPPNDGGIAIGQLAALRYRTREVK